MWMVWCNDDLWFSSPEFYATFWQMSMYDIHVPEVQYATQARLLREEKDAIEREQRNSVRMNNLRF
jgi:hypothetical protein